MKHRDLWLELYPNIGECSLQTFDDSKKDKSLARIISMNDAEKRNKIEALQKAWAGVFFSVNCMTEWNRDKSSVTKVNAWICEIDWMSKENQRKLVDTCPLYPSAIVETKNSLHLYWIAKDWTKERWYDIANGLRNYFDGDEKVVDISRVLRLPWYNHLKDPAEPYQVNIVVFKEDAVYTQEQMLTRYPDFRPLSEIRKLAKLREITFKAEMNDDTFWNRVNAMDAKKMLTSLSGSVLVNWDIITFNKNSDSTEQIWVNGKSTSCWIDLQWLIGSSSWWWPSWVNRVFWYWTDGKAIHRWLMQNHPYILENKHTDAIIDRVAESKINNNFKHITYKEKLERSMNEILLTDADKILKRWWDERDNLLGGIYGWKIYLIGADTGVGKTTFVNQVVSNIESTGERVVRYSLEDRMEDLGKEELFYEVNKLRRTDYKEFYKWTAFVNNEYKDAEFASYLKRAFDNLSVRNVIELDRKTNVTIDDLIALMEEECKKWTRIFTIDHLHYFEWDTTQAKERLDLQIQNAMHKINEVARKNNVAIFLVAHYRQLWREEKSARPHYWMFKDWASIKQVANIIIQITRDTSDETDTKSTFYITKLRWPIKTKELESEFNLSTFEYTFHKSEKQKKKQNDYLSKLASFNH